MATLRQAPEARKTTVMAMIIAWQTVNAVRRPGSRRFSRGFLVVTPGLTIRDRLRVLQPNDPDSYYRGRELVPAAESHPRVRAYVKNDNLGFEAPCRFGSEARRYRPDFIVLVDDGRGVEDPLHLVVEVKGYRREDAREKKAAMDTFRVPGVNRLGRRCGAKRTVQGWKKSARAEHRPCGRRTYGSSGATSQTRSPPRSPETTGSTWKDAGTGHGYAGAHWCCSVRKKTWRRRRPGT